MKQKFKDGWEIIPADSKAGLFMEEDWEERLSPIIDKEQQIIYNMLKLFIPEEYGYYFDEIHEHDEPEDIPHGEGVWRTVYSTPLGFYYKAGEYNIINTTSTEEYIYYAIGLHGCSLQSALTEYVRVPKEQYWARSYTNA